MAKALKYETVELTAIDNDGDEYPVVIAYAKVTEETAGLEVALRNGDAKVLKKGEVVVVENGKYDVFSPTQWAETLTGENIVNQDSPDPEPEPEKDRQPAKKAAASGNRS
jgi:hypothetical protein